MYQKVNWKKASVLLRHWLQYRNVTTSTAAETSSSSHAYDNTHDQRTAPKANLKMCGWQIHGYGGIDELQFSEKVKMPQIRSSNAALVRVQATSVNPIDIAMLGGYGSKLLNVMRCQPDIEFPITLGREFCGELVQRGMGGELRELELGDRVWGVVPVEAQGAHAEYVSVPDYCIARAPSSLSVEEAASILYAGLTAWSGLYISAGLDGICGAICSKPNGNSAKNKRVLVLGGSGSVGSLAIQMLRAEGAQVVATCSEDALELVTQSGADMVVDYKNPVELQNLRNFGPFDIVLDCAGQGTQFVQTSDIPYHQFITFSSPFLKNVDSSGLGIGLIKNLVDLVETNAASIRNRKGLVKWGFFTPAPQGIKYLKELVDKKKILPNIDSNFTFDKLPDAFKRVQEGHLRGKVVVTMK